MEDIHKIRADIADENKDLTVEEIIAKTNSRAQIIIERLKEKTKKLANFQKSVDK